MTSKKNSKVFLVGAGPGNLGLVTLRAKECIERAEVIVYDHLANPEMLGWAREDAEIIYAGKRANEHALSQEEINEVAKATPVGHWGGEAEIAKTVVLLCQTDFITGETIRVDGGRHLA